MMLLLLASLSLVVSVISQHSHVNWVFGSYSPHVADDVFVDVKEIVGISANVYMVQSNSGLATIVTSMTSQQYKNVKYFRNCESNGLSTRILVFNDGTMKWERSGNRGIEVKGAPRILKMLRSMEIDDMVCFPSGILLVKGEQEALLLQPPSDGSYNWVISRFANVDKFSFNGFTMVQHDDDHTTILWETEPSLEQWRMEMLNISAKITDVQMGHDGQQPLVAVLLAESNLTQVYFYNGTVKETYQQISSLHRAGQTVVGLTSKQTVVAIVSSAKTGPVFPELRGIVALFPFAHDDFIALRDDGYTTMLYSKELSVPVDIKQVFTGGEKSVNFAALDSTGDLHIIIPKRTGQYQEPCSTTIADGGSLITNVAVRTADVCFNHGNDFYCQSCNAAGSSPVLMNANCSTFVSATDMFLCTDIVEGLQQQQETKRLNWGFDMPWDVFPDNNVWVDIKEVMVKNINAGYITAVLSNEGQATLQLSTDKPIQFGNVKMVVPFRDCELFPYAVIMNDGKVLFGNHERTERDSINTIPTLMSMLRDIKVDAILCESSAVLVQQQDQALLIQSYNSFQHAKGDAVYDWKVSRFSQVTKIFHHENILVVQEKKTARLFYKRSDKDGQDLHVINISAQVSQVYFKFRHIIASLTNGTTAVLFQDGTLREKQDGLIRVFETEDSLFALTAKQTLSTIFDAKNNSGQLFPELRGIVGLYPYGSDDFIALRDDGYATLLYHRNTTLAQNMKQVFSSKLSGIYAYIDSQDNFNVKAGTCTRTIPGPVTNVMFRDNQVCFTQANNFHCETCEPNPDQPFRPLLTNANCSKLVPFPEKSFTRAGVICSDITPQKKQIQQLLETS